MRSVTELRAAIAEAGVARRSMALVVGPLGGGPHVCRWLASALGADDSPAPTSDGGWTWPGGRVRDLTSHDSLSGPVEPGAVLDLLSAPPRVARLYDRIVDLRLEPELAQEWFADIFPGSPVARTHAPAGRLVSEAVDLGLAMTSELRLADLPSYQAFESHLLAVGGARFLDFARVVALVHPRAVHVGDEWVQLANHIGGRSWSVADLSILLLECPEAFAMRTVDEAEEARFSSPFLRDVVSSRVPTSTSEHYALFCALRDMAVQSLLRSDPGDRFVAKELALQALMGNAVEELCDDGMGLLAADPRALLTVIEDPRSPVSQGAKLVLRAAHRLGRSDTLSQLELAARRSGLVRLADQMSAGSPARQWHPIWATSQPVNTNRVIFSAAANVMCLTTVPDPLSEPCLIGLSSGQIWEVSVADEPRLVWQDSNASEVRCITSQVERDTVVAFTGHSDQTIRATVSADGSELWAETTTMTGPLSAIASTSTGAAGAVVVAGGVDGRLGIFRAADGSLVCPPVDLGAEIRGIGIIATLTAACLVDGTIVAVTPDGRSILWRVAVPGDAQVCNAMSVVATPAGHSILVGTSAGGIYELHLEEWDRAPAVSEVAQLGSSINTLFAEHDGRELVMYVGLSNASWLKKRSSDANWTPHLGHVGSVNALTVTDHGRVLTGSGEGTVRSWIPRFIDSESIALEWGVRHRGPVTGINIDIAAGVEDVMQVTGGADGSLRAWSGPGDNTGTLIAEHDSPVKSLIWSPTTATVYVGHADGVLRSVRRTDGVWRPHLIGIQHDGVKSLALSPTGRLFSAGVDGTVARWHQDLMSGAVTRRVSEFGHIAALAWLNQSLVVGAQDGTVALLEPRHLEPILSTDLGSSVVSVAAHGRAVFAGQSNGEVVAMPDFGRLDATEERRIRLHNGEVRGIQAFELGGNLVIATTGLDRRLVITDLRSNSVLADIALDGFGLGLHAVAPFIAVSTTSGAMIVELSPELPGFLAVPGALRG